MRGFAFASLAFAGLAAAAPALQPRDFGTLTTDVNDISTKLGAVHDALAGFDGTTRQSALNIDTAAQALLQSLQTATSDAGSTGQLDADQSNQGIALLQGLVPTVQDSLKLLVSDEPAFNGLGVAGVAKADNAALAGASDDFANALLSIADPSTTAQGQAIKQQIDDAFATATAAYAND